jgi:hypothetical protein
MRFGPSFNTILKLAFVAQGPLSPQSTIHANISPALLIQQASNSQADPNMPLLIPCPADPSRVQPFVVHPLTTAEQCAQAALELQNLDQVHIKSPQKSNKT